MSMHTPVFDCSDMFTSKVVHWDFLAPRSTRNQQ